MSATRKARPGKSWVDEERRRLNRRLKIRLPRRRSQESLEAWALRHTRKIAEERGFLVADQPDQRQIDRYVINMLRHRCTNYDQTQHRQQDYLRILDAIANRYPWLAGECARQIRRRNDRLGDDTAA